MLNPFFAYISPDTLFKQVIAIVYRNMNKLDKMYERQMCCSNNLISSFKSAEKIDGFSYFTSK